MSAATDQFTEDALLTGVTNTYRNPDYTLIADDVLPRIDVDDDVFKYHVYDEAENFTVPDTHVGRRSAPNQVELEGTETEGSCKDYGIDIPLDKKTIDQAEKRGRNPRLKAVERSTNIILLDREVRVANMIEDAASYHADHVDVLATGSHFDEEVADPVKIIEDMLDRCYARPNQLVFGLVAWRAFRRHPKVVKAVHKNSGDEGRVAREAAAELLEVSRIFVGESRVNIKRPGEQAVLERVWGNTVTGQFLDRSADNNGGVTFGFTAQNGKRIGGTLPANMGLHGGILVRAGETVAEKIVANRAGFLLQNVVKDVA